MGHFPGNFPKTAWKQKNLHFFWKNCMKIKEFGVFIAVINFITLDDSIRETGTVWAPKVCKNSGSHIFDAIKKYYTTVNILAGSAPMAHTPGKGINKLGEKTGKK